MSKVQIDRECTNKCAFIEHGDNISSAITKRGVTDEELCAFIYWKCSGCGQVNDSMGRNAVHFAASCGRTKLLKWLLTQAQSQSQYGININAKDLESGYSALHRSIFYGKINSAVTLIRLGANMNLLDNNDLRPLDHAMKDGLNYREFSASTSLCQAYVWGTNANDTLGTGHQHGRQQPDLHDAFHKKYSDASVLQVCLSKFHSVIVSREGRVFSCGHGQGGRLGLNTENTILIPEEVHLTSNLVTKTNRNSVVCVEVAVGLDHTIFLTDNGQVWSCGLNTHRVLGVKPAPVQQLQPKPVAHLPEIRGVCAARFHSVAWTTSAVYTWGLHAGQLGHDKSSHNTYIIPKIVSNPITNKDAVIVCVAASDGATVVATKHGDIFVFHQYQIRKITSKQLNIEKVFVVGGQLNSKLSHDILVEKGGNELKVLMLQTTGNLYLWQESWPQLSRCIYSLNRPLIVRDAVLSRTQVFFVTVDGEAFRGEFKTRKKKTPHTTGLTNKTTFHEFLDKDECQMIKVHRYPHVHRALKIHCDLKGRNFAVIQCAPQFQLSDTVPKVSRNTIAQDMLNLLNDSNEMDTIHDAVFKVSGQIFAVHRFIIASKSEHLNALIESNGTSTSTEPIELINIDPVIFKEILSYIYGGTCKSSPIGLMQQAAKRFGLKGRLCKQLENNKCKVKFDRHRFKHFHDVVIETKNGTEMYAHKCILAARLDYFNNLFALRWNNVKNKCNKITLPINDGVLETVLDFLYTDEAPLAAKGTDGIDHISNVLIVADQLFIGRLKEICELALSALLTLRNAAYVLQFASTYNAMQLKRCTMQFVCINLAALLEARALQILHDDILNELTEFYCNRNEMLCSRIITPYSDAPPDEIVKSISTMYPVSVVDDDAPEHQNVERKTFKLNSSARKKQRIRTTTTTTTTTTTRSSTTKANVVRTKSSSSRQFEFESESESESEFESSINMHQKSEIQIENKYTDTDTDENSKWIKILSDKQQHKKLIQTRLHAVHSATDKILSEEIPSNLTKIISPSSIIYDIPIKMEGKLSQKQRKKIDEINKCSSSSSSSSNNINNNSPKNPWKKIETPSSVIPCSKREENFLNITTEEKKQKENWSKMRARPLIYNQIEDKAIHDLERFYNIEHVTDECITIHKVEKGMFAIPLWVHNN